jgi:methylamine dehydrogenase accessory protein MauD
MSTYLIVSQVMLWLAVIGLGVIVIALARQIGVLHERIAPVGALKIDTGPAVGEKVPALALATLGGGFVQVGQTLAKGRLQLLLFVSPDCPVCKEIIPIAKSFARDERLSVLYVSDGRTEDLRRFVERVGLDAQAFVNSPEVGMRFGVGKLPYAVLIDDAAVVAASGLVNSREHFESLVVAKQMGLPSVQAYLRQQTSASTVLNAPST